MPNSDNRPTPDDPYLQVLVGMVSELTAIRKELQKMNHTEPEDLDEFNCKCGVTLYGESQAKEHAVNNHNAPTGHWEEMYS